MKFDFDNLWSTTTHPKICSKNGFGGREYKLLRKYSKKADKYPCGSNAYYSAPFHARENALQIGARLYNLALKAKRSDTPLRFSFKGEDNRINISFLKYINKTDSEKTEKAQSGFLRIIDNKNPKTQADMLLGLSLHIIQDFFAHVARVDLYGSKEGFYPDELCLTEREYHKLKAFEADEIIGLRNSQFEDNIRVMEWRYRETCNITRAISEKWKSDSPIMSITAEETGELKFYKRIKRSLRGKFYWTVCYYEYKWKII